MILLLIEPYTKMPDIYYPMYILHELRSITKGIVLCVATKFWSLCLFAFLYVLQIPFLITVA